MKKQRVIFQKLQEKEEQDPSEAEELREDLDLREVLNPQKENPNVKKS